MVGDRNKLFFRDLSVPIQLAVISGIANFVVLAFVLIVWVLIILFSIFGGV